MHSFAAPRTTSDDAAKTYPGLWHFRRDQRQLFLLFFFLFFRLARDHLYARLLDALLVINSAKRGKERKEREASIEEAG